MGIIYDAQELKTGAEFLDEHSEEMVFMGIPVTRNDYVSVYEDGYIGFVTFFASDDVGWGASHDHWEFIGRMARASGLDFVPTVSPGFDESVLGKWDKRKPRPRKCFAYYDERWTTALHARPKIVMIHSFNSWSEGSAIEPVVNRENYALSDDVWCGTDSMAFMARTAGWIDRFRRL
jgi:glycoprotein endo-alpha-1,2-mannosidase